ncbi:cupin domain-containing protein [Burkholderia sp. Ac-20353]|uniref:cupin domain-containing protein n=1 Tax=Burkholderia sp. Ac-20353 TaxID=2703894 RepID=UPI00197CB1A6|nr:cupin domain-containing protein [Burkholderia sp. Ac-20353]MBN3791631.1 DUF861 domain-containing protein [Burkholderia sp. Ac-20353]
MKVQKIARSVATDLPEDWGTAGLSGTEPARVSGRQVVIPGSEAIDTGVFECTPGTYRRVVKEAEVMHFIAGAGSFTPDGEATIEFHAGDTLFFAANTEGLWQVRETMRKIYVIF